MLTNNVSRIQTELVLHLHKKPLHRQLNDSNDELASHTAVPTTMQLRRILRFNK